MKYFAYMNNDGGCDYTIGCNRELVELPANSMREALELLRHELVEHGRASVDEERSYFTSDIGELREITVFEVSNSVQVDVGPIKAQHKERQRELEKERKQSERRAEYERLKQEFGEG